MPLLEFADDFKVRFIPLYDHDAHIDGSCKVTIYVYKVTVITRNNRELFVKNAF